MRFVAGWGVCVIVLSLSTACWSAEQAAPPAEAAKADAPSQSAQFQQVFAQWKALLKEMRTLRTDYKHAEPSQRGEIRKQYDELTERAEAVQRQVLDAVEKAYAATPGADPQLTGLLMGLSGLQLQRENYEEALRLARILLDHQAPERPLYNVAAVAAFNTGHFDDAERYLKAAREARVATEDTEEQLKDLEYYKQVWPREEKLRAAEAKADDLPRVLLKTNKGDIELELFENEAPIAVANFISLVEKGFYTRLAFHRVLPKFMAQGGCPKGNGSGGPGYTIPCECYQPNHRLHFRGSLSMAHRGRDTGGSQFFLTFVPTHNLDGKHTVFGRVVKGMDVLAKLQRRDPTKEEQPDPDGILEAKVLRKRDHPYEPKKLAE